MSCELLNWATMLDVVSQMSLPLWLSLSMKVWPALNQVCHSNMLSTQNTFVQSLPKFPSHFSWNLHTISSEICTHCIFSDPSWNCDTLCTQFQININIFVKSRNIWKANWNNANSGYFMYIWVFISQEKYPECVLASLGQIVTERICTTFASLNPQYIKSVELWKTVSSTYSHREEALIFNQISCSDCIQGV